MSVDTMATGGLPGPPLFKHGRIYTHTHTHSNALNVQHPRRQEIHDVTPCHAASRIDQLRRKRFSVRSRYSTPMCLVLNQRGEPGRVLTVWGGEGGSTRVLLFGEEGVKPTHAIGPDMLLCWHAADEKKIKKKITQTKTKSGGSSPREGEYHTALVTTGSTGQRTGNVTRTSAQLLRRTARCSPVWGSGRWWGTLGRPAGEAQQGGSVYTQDSDGPKVRREPKL